MRFENLKYLIVGAGFYGATMAERIASQLNEKVVVLDIRDHIGGNSYSEVDAETGIEVHKYGSHIFHTSNESVFRYLSQFTTFNSYQHKVLTKHFGKTYQMPISLFTINSFFNTDFSPAEAQAFIAKEIGQSAIQDPKNLEEKAISLVGKRLYEAFIKGYTQKQWETPLDQLPANIITRLPFRYSYNDRYFADKYEGIPTDGYTSIFKKMLNHPNIEVKLKTDFFAIKHLIPKSCKIIYTGPIDKYFNYSLGELGWRTTDFEVERHSVLDYQGTSVMNYADLDVAYTRIHEFKHYHPERDYNFNKTIIYKEFSRKAKGNDIPYYPINTDRDKALFNQYRELAQKEKNVIFGGRLGNYVYVDMHQAVAMALNAFESQLSGKGKN